MAIEDQFRSVINAEVMEFIRKQHQHVQAKEHKASLIWTVIGIALAVVTGLLLRLADPFYNGVILGFLMGVAVAVSGGALLFVKLYSQQVAQIKERELWISLHDEHLIVQTKTTAAQTSWAGFERLIKGDKFWLLKVVDIDEYVPLVRETMSNQCGQFLETKCRLWNIPVVEAR